MSHTYRISPAASPVSLLTGAIGLVLCLCGSMMNAQNPYISKFVPRNPLNPQNSDHRIELFNENSKDYLDLSGYLLVTRHYIFRIPANTFIGPMKAIRLGDVASETNRGLDLEYIHQRDFSTREAEGKDEGDFAVLYDRSRNIVDAFYYGPQKTVSFIPTRVSLSTYRENIEVTVPDEEDSRWSYLQNVEDPAMAFVCVNQNWHPTSRRSNLFPATRYRFLQARYVEGIITVSWKTLFENDCYVHTIERSTDGNSFEVLEKLRGPVNSQEPFDYTYYDAVVEKNRVYYYRVVSIDKFGNTVLSSLTKIRTEENPGGFAFDILPADKHSTSSLNVRFSAKENQNVRIKLLDEQLREIAILYQGTIEAGKQNLLNYTQPLPVGKYFVIVSTNERRYYEPFVVD
ncbi:MAG: hypothetical protein SF052_09880 [Bacteroidia bacterium]|nr:hypothetical protein [Bacteroidia bacterium]